LAKGDFTGFGEEHTPQTRKVMKVSVSSSGQPALQVLKARTERKMYFRGFTFKWTKNDVMKLQSVVFGHVCVVGCVSFSMT